MQHRSGKPINGKNSSINDIKPKRSRTRTIKWETNESFKMLMFTLGDPIALLCVTIKLLIINTVFKLEAMDTYLIKFPSPITLNILILQLKRFSTKVLKVQK